MNHSAFARTLLQGVLPNRVFLADHVLRMIKRENNNECPVWAEPAPQAVHTNMSCYIHIAMMNEVSSTDAKAGLHGRDDALMRIVLGDSHLFEINRSRSKISNSTIKKAQLDALISGSGFPPLVLVEEKGLSESSLNDASRDLCKKFFRIPHYHRLPFVIGIAVHYHMVRILRISQTHQMEEFEGGQFNLILAADRIRCIHALLNIGRYCTTVMVDPSKYMYRAPYFFKQQNGASSTVLLMFDRVRKTYTADECLRPDWQANLLEFYRCVAGEEDLLVEKLVNHKKTKCEELVVSLMPVGVVRRPMDSEIPDLVVQVASTLCRLHELGWTHNDVRLPNIIVLESKWYLIDCEYASKLGKRFIRKPPAELQSRSTTQRDIHAFAKVLRDLSSDISDGALAALVAGISADLSSGLIALEDVRSRMVAKRKRKHVAAYTGDGIVFSEKKRRK